MTSRSPDEVLELLTKAMAEAGVEFTLLGGYAVMASGVPRATFDVDLLIEVDEQQLQRCFEQLRQRRRCKTPAG